VRHAHLTPTPVRDLAAKASATAQDRIQRSLQPVVSLSEREDPPSEGPGEQLLAVAFELDRFEIIVIGRLEGKFRTRRSLILLPDPDRLHGTKNQRDETLQELGAIAKTRKSGLVRTSRIVASVSFMDPESRIVLLPADDERNHTVEGNRCARKERVRDVLQIITLLQPLLEIGCLVPVLSEEESCQQIAEGFGLPFGGAIRPFVRETLQPFLEELGTLRIPEIETLEDAHLGRNPLSGKKLVQVVQMSVSLSKQEVESMSEFVLGPSPGEACEGRSKALEDRLVIPRLVPSMEAQGDPIVLSVAVRAILLDDETQESERIETQGGEADLQIDPLAPQSSAGKREPAIESFFETRETVLIP